eukprot:1058431-Prorocentrum_minimum.AAC.1
MKAAHEPPPCSVQDGKSARDASALANIPSNSGRHGRGRYGRFSGSFIPLPCTYLSSHALINESTPDARKSTRSDPRFAGKVSKLSCVEAFAAALYIWCAPPTFRRGSGGGQDSTSGARRPLLGGGQEGFRRGS